MVDVLSNPGTFVEHGYRAFTGSLLNLKKLSEKRRVDEFFMWYQHLLLWFVFDDTNSLKTYRSVMKTDPM